MRLCRFGDSRLGVVEDGAEGNPVGDVTTALDVLPPAHHPFPRHAPSQASAFEALVADLRRSEEWTYVEREVDVRLTRAEAV